MNKCTLCQGSGRLDLPVGDGVDTFNCPCCIPWTHGFGGYGYKKNGEMIWVIEPSKPNQLARHNMEGV